MVIATMLTAFAFDNLELLIGVEVSIKSIKFIRCCSYDSDVEFDHQIGKPGAVNQYDRGTDSFRVFFRLSRKSASSEEHSFLGLLAQVGAGEPLNFGVSDYGRPLFGLQLNWS